MRRHCIRHCIAVHLFGNVWASRLIYKDTMYRSNTPELFWSNTSVVVFLFSGLVPSSVNTLLLTGANEGAGTRPGNRPPGARQSQCQVIGGDPHGRSTPVHGTLHGIWSRSPSGSSQQGRGPGAAQDMGAWPTKCDPHTPHRQQQAIAHQTHQGT